MTRTKFSVLVLAGVLAAGAAGAQHEGHMQAQSPAESQTEDPANQAGETETAHQAEDQVDQAGAQGQSGHEDTGANADHQFEGNE